MDSLNQSAEPGRQQQGPQWNGTDWPVVQTAKSPSSILDRKFASWSLSFLLHGGLITTAMLSSRLPHWTSDVARGRAIQLTVSMGSDALPMTSATPPMELSNDEIEPQHELQAREVNVTKQAFEPTTVMLEFDLEDADLSAVNRLEPSQVLYDMPAHKEPTIELPEIQATMDESERDVVVQPRRVIANAATGPVLPTTIDQLAGASSEEPPTPDPQNPPPVYPYEAQRQQRQGRVILAVRIDAQGVVESISVSTSSGHIDLDRAAIEAVQQWKFSPSKRQGQNVTADVHVPVRFTIRPRS